MNRIDRLTAILIQLQTKKVVKAQEIADRFSITLRTVYRDVKALMEAGVPIGSEAGTGYFIVDGFHLPPVMFSRDEASALIMAGKLIERMTDASVKKAFESALMKIKAVLNEGDKDYLEMLQASVEVSRFPAPQNEEFPNNFLNDIQQALVNKTVLSLAYAASGAEVTAREVEPIGLQYYSGAWHLIAWCRLRNGYRDFRVDRIKALTQTPQRFDPRNLISLQEYLQTLMQSYHELHKVVVRFDQSVYQYRRYIYGAVAEEDLGDSVRLTFLVSNFDWLSHWLLSFGSGVTIESPEELRQIMSNLVEELQEHYLKMSAS